MVSYNWKCQACDATVQAENSICHICGCPAEVTGLEIKKIMERIGVKSESRIEYPIPVWIVWGALIVELCIAWLYFEFDHPLLGWIFKLLLPPVIVVFLIDWWATVKHINNKIFGN